ncbi:MAG: EamA family transporter [Betaproteobacteria bacterium]
MQPLTTRQWLVLALLTLVWGINWPVLKLGVTGFPPLTFRFICLLIGTPVLGAALWLMKVPFRVPSP